MADPVEIVVTRIEGNVANILEKVEYIPILCDAVARHDERIGTLERVAKWILGILAAVLAGLGIFGFEKLMR